MSDRSIIAKMAEHLAESDVDLAHEFQIEVELSLSGFWPTDIDKYMSAAIDRARALRAENMEMIR